MFHFMRERARSEKGRANCTRLVLEELEARDVPAVHAAAPGLARSAHAVSRPPPTMNLDQVIRIDHGALDAKVASVALAAHGNRNGAAGEIPAFFDGQSVTINVKELPDNAETFALPKNPSVRIIYVTNDLDDPQEFNPVINAIPGQHFNALWHQVQISFTGSTPHQFTSEADILAAAQAGEITLIDTGEVYRDSVVRGSSHNG